jgi:hypothetical protein
MTRYKVTSPNPRYSGEVATLKFRAGEATADTPGDAAALAYCQRRGYTVAEVVADEDVPASELPEAPDPAAAADEVKRPADYATKPEWVAYAVSRGATEEDAQAATKNELVELYG